MIRDYRSGTKRKFGGERGKRKMTVRLSKSMGNVLGAKKQPTSKERRLPQCQRGGIELLAEIKTKDLIE